MTLSLPIPVGILGFGVEGQSTLRYLQSQGISEIIVLDSKAVHVDNVLVHSGENYLDGLKDCASVVRSAGVNPLIPELLRFQMNGGLVTSQIQIFMETTKSRAVVGVTGTLGKGTCVTMLEHILKDQGIDCVIGGNYGVAALDLLADESPNCITLLELSSFQLMTLSRSPSLGIVLRTTSEHLDWHRSVEEYRDAKANLVRYQKATDTCIYFDDAPGSREIAQNGRGRKLAVGSSTNCMVRLEGQQLFLNNEVLDLSQCQVQGTHQLENMGVALLASWVLGVPVAKGMIALHSYSGLIYRLQYKGTKNSVQYWNDSYATRPEATLAAAQSMKVPFSLILGGSEKNADFTELAQGLARIPLLYSIALIGQTAARLEQTLMEHEVGAIIERFDTSFPAAFHWSSEQMSALKRETAVLLSPACASFGLFTNYKERGKAFDLLVDSLGSKNV